MITVPNLSTAVPLLYSALIPPLRSSLSSGASKRNKGQKYTMVRAEKIITSTNADRRGTTYMTGLVGVALEDPINVHGRRIERASGQSPL